MEDIYWVLLWFFGEVGSSVNGFFDCQSKCSSIFLFIIFCFLVVYSVDCFQCKFLVFIIMGVQSVVGQFFSLNVVYWYGNDSWFSFLKFDFYMFNGIFSD